MQVDYKQKYLKYKGKYEQLKQIRGGGAEDEFIDLIFNNINKINSLNDIKNKITDINKKFHSMCNKEKLPKISIIKILKRLNNFVLITSNIYYILSGNQNTNYTRGVPNENDKYDKYTIEHGLLGISHIENNFKRFNTPLTNETDTNKHIKYNMIKYLFAIYHICNTIIPNTIVIKRNNNGEDIYVFIPEEKNDISKTISCTKLFTENNEKSEKSEKKGTDIQLFMEFLNFEFDTTPNI
jgi:hypothetical protein